MTPTLGHQTPAGMGVSTVLADFDFETYSEAGYIWNGKRWGALQGTNSGIKAVGAAAYAEHPSTEVLSLAYDLKDGSGPQLWFPGMPDPVALFNHFKDGKNVEAWNAMFEFHIWQAVCVERMGWPPIHLDQLRCAMAKSRAYSMPGKLSDAARVVGAEVQKEKEGKRLIKKFCCPRTPTKKDPRKRIATTQDPADATNLYAYNIYDIQAEAATSALMPDLQPVELELWKLDHKINQRGVNIDMSALMDLRELLAQARIKYNAELLALTGGAVDKATKNAELKKWLESRGTFLPNMQKGTLEERAALPFNPPDVARALWIRLSLGSSSVAKLEAIFNRLSKDGRLRDLFAFCGADRTGRFAGRGPQPQNLPNSGPTKDWDIHAVEKFLEVARSRDLDMAEQLHGDVIAAISGSLRALFCAGPGNEFICSDYSAIEAVVIAELAGEQWRIDVFNGHGKIYEMSAAKITGIAFEEFVAYKRDTGDHHPARKKIGKVAELASAYGGGLGAWKAFGADAFMDDNEIRDNVKLWRKESPQIVKFWYGLQDAATLAIQNPGTYNTYRDIMYIMRGDVLFCKLPSGRYLHYHLPRLEAGETSWGKPTLEITYMGHNSDSKKGPVGWFRLRTWGGKLAENVTQAVARDLLTFAMPLVESGGYPIVLHVHDELISEVPAGYGTIEEYEQLMGSLPPWAAHWPVKAAGGWRGQRYRKD